MSGTEDIRSKNNTNDRFVAVEPTGRECLWTGLNKFRVICCKDAFSVKTTCKFAFCPPCVIEVRERLSQGHGGETGERTNSRSSKRKKAMEGVAGAVSTTGKNKTKGGGGVCGKHTLKDLLTMDHEQTNKSYLKKNREKVLGAENIAVHCVSCGIKI